MFIQGLSLHTSSEPLFQIISFPYKQGQQTNCFKTLWLLPVARACGSSLICSDIIASEKSACRIGARLFKVQTMRSAQAATREHGWMIHSQYVLCMKHITCYFSSEEGKLTAQEGVTSLWVKHSTQYSTQLELLNFSNCRCLLEINEKEIWRQLSGGLLGISAAMFQL